MNMSVNWHELQPDQVIGELEKGKITTSHIMRWSAAVENFHRIHYDAPFAIEHDKLPGVVVNGSWKQHVLVQLVKDSLGEQGWLWRLSFRYKAMDLAGDSINAVASVVSKHLVDGLGFVVLRVELRNQSDKVTTAGYAIGVLPVSRSVPYPFEYSPAYEAIEMPAIE